MTRETTPTRRIDPAAIKGLYAITPDGLETGELLARCVQAICGGARVLQYRNKTADGADRFAQAYALAHVCKENQVLFIVNDDFELAQMVDADGVHLGKSDASIIEARANLPGKLIGVSCYDEFKRAQRAVAEGADYVAFGSVFASPTKPDAIPAKLTLFKKAKALEVPLVAIGGITRGNAAQVRAAGADACAVISDLFGDAATRWDEVGARAAAFRAILE